MAISLTERDDGRRIQVQVGDTIEIRLPENAPAGYRWGVDSLDERLFELTGSSGDYPTATTGSAGEALLRVTVRAPGEGTLRLKYWRSWEGAAGVLKRFTLDVQALPQ
ncbi:protease inhibitor I42 family protein [Mycolicibacter heraklionensis]|uniref:Protease inhibitor I42 family protein n=1 Tax=Mycolicibacter heraklionensis TaxID=512402 RepID=A0A9X7ZIL1_9MYCO|nr:protease inhibitor I42 family protein [Mycolicibacter heraklionensis]QZA08733.1 protease inhibitor I42 family protein [Mycolicibacter heraklionensis]